jgi:hypothetical protein
VLRLELEAFATLEVTPLEVHPGRLTTFDGSLAPSTVNAAYLVGHRVVEGEELYRYVDMKERIEAALETLPLPVELPSGSPGNSAERPLPSTRGITTR